MKNNDLIFVENSLKVEDFIRLKDEAFSCSCDVNTAKVSLDGSLYVLHVQLQGKVIGMARIVGDGGYVNFLADVVVDPRFQGTGIGRRIMEEIIAYIKSNIPIGGRTMVALFSAKGKEDFYKKFGFVTRKEKNLGHGMFLDLLKL